MKREVQNFCIDQIMRSGQCFRINKISDNTYTVIHKDHYLEITEGKDGGYTFSCSDADMQSIWAPYFDLNQRVYAEIRKIVDPEDAFLKNAIDYGQGIRILNQDLWETMVCFMISQNNNIPRIKKTIEELCSRLGEIHETRPGSSIEKYHSMPSPEAIAAAGLKDLKECGLGYRAEYLKSLGENIIDSRINLESLKEIRGYEGIHNVLISIKGIGPKVAACIELFGLHRFDALPIDTWMKKIINQKYAGYFPSNKYPGFEGLMQQYMFFYALEHKDEFKEEEDHAYDG